MKQSKTGPSKRAKQASRRSKQNRAAKKSRDKKQSRPSKNGPVKKQSRSANHEAELGSVEALQLASIACVLAFASILRDRARPLVNQLRGNEMPRSDLLETEDIIYHGCLYPVSSRWLHELISVLVQAELLLELDDGSLYPSEDGELLLLGEIRVSPDFLPNAPRLGVAPDLERELTELRRNIAKNEGRPAFSIFDNPTLARLVDSKPRTLGELATVEGFGPRRLQAYGRKITNFFRRHENLDLSPRS